MKTIYLFVVFLIMTAGQTIDAQGLQWEWGRQSIGPAGFFGGPMSTDPNGNVYMTGSFGGDSAVFGNVTLRSSYGSSDHFFLVKYSPSGSMIWARTVRSHRSGGSGIATDANGNVYVTGHTEGDTLDIDGSLKIVSPLAYKGFIIKYDSMGNALWAAVQRMATLGMNNVATDTSGNAYLNGSFNGDSLILGSYILRRGSPTSTTMFTVKYSATGNVVWAKTAPVTVPISTSGSCLTVDKSGNVYSRGGFMGDSIAFGSTVIHSPLSHIGTHIFILKYDNAGNLLWVRGGVGDANNFAYDMVTDPGGNLYMPGYFDGDSVTFDGHTLHTLSPNATNRMNFFFVKYNTNGIVQWLKGSAGSGNNYAAGIALDQGGNLYVTGHYQDNIVFDTDTLRGGTVAKPDDMFVVTFDPEGRVICGGTLSTENADFPGIRAGLHGDVFVSTRFQDSLMVLGGDSLFLTSHGNVFIAKFRCTNVTTGIEDVSKGREITVYPNPSTGIFSFSGVQEGDEIEVYDVMGRKVESSQADHSIDLSGKPRGVYFYRITGQGSLVRQGKMMVE